MTSSRLRIDGDTTTAAPLADPNINIGFGHLGRDVRIHICTFLDARSLGMVCFRTAKILRELFGRNFPTILDKAHSEHTTLDLRTSAARYALQRWHRETRSTLQAGDLFALMRNVRELFVPATSLGWIKALMQAQFPRCSRLALVGEGWDASVPEKFPTLLRSFPNLQELTIEPGMPDQNIPKAISEHCNHLTALDYLGEISSDETAAILKTNPELTALKISRVDETFVAHFNTTKLTKLHSKELPWRNPMICLKSLTNFIELSFKNASALDNDCVQFMAKNLHGLEVLRIPRIRAEGCTLVAAMQLLSKLRVLDISENKWDDALAVRAVSYLPDLQELNLSDNPRITDACLFALAQHRCIDKIAKGEKTIEFDETRETLSFAPAKTIVHFSGPPFPLNLTKLGLRRLPRITELGLEAIFQAHPLRSLDILGVSFTVVHKVLSSLRNLTDLTTGWPNSEERELGIELFKVLPKHLPNLSRLFFILPALSPVTPDNQTCKAITLMHNLRKLNLQGFQREQFEKARPDVVVSNTYT